METTGYQNLQNHMRAAGLYERRYRAYIGYAAVICAGLAAGFFILTVSNSLLVQIPNAIFTAFFLVQAGMLGHDFSHLQVCKSKKYNRFFGRMLWSLVCGLSESGWYAKHNAHHTHVNHVDRDPDLGMPFIFSQKQLKNKSKFFTRYILPRQHIIFFFALPLAYISMTAWSLTHMLRIRSWQTLADAVCVAVRYAVFFGLPFLFLPTAVALWFLIVQTAVIGIYMSVVFAPNHKGAVVVDDTDTPTWTHQIILTRNVVPSFGVFFLLGGLNFQIEHHLFSTMSRFHYAAARPIVKQFCETHGIPYHETTWIGSMQEIYRSLKTMAAFYSAERDYSHLFFRKPFSFLVLLVKRIRK